MRPRTLVLLVGALLLPLGALAHPAPFSYLDLHLRSVGLEATLVVHVIDMAHELKLAKPDLLLHPGIAESYSKEIAAIVGARLHVLGDGRDARVSLDGIDPLNDRQALRLHLRVDMPAAPGLVTIRAKLFPYDPTHQTFLNVYERDTLAHQAIFDSDHLAFEYFPGTRQGTMAVLRRFIPAGIRHIMIGPDHILFLIGLLLLGGGTWRLLKIVTAFTAAHSMTLSLAALGVLNPPARIIEPAIALSIIYVGTDNLLVAKDGRDVRAWVALAFGFVHGFGFAYVLKEFGLPRQALGWSLFSFNFGVEIGQILIVALVASALALVRGYSEALGRRVVFAGSIAVIGGGTYWFVQRVFFAGA